MSGLLLERSLIPMAACPFCRADVVLGDCEPREEPAEVGVWERPDPVAAAPPRWWVCVHGPDEHGHVWETRGPIEIRPVWSIHVEVVDPHRPVTVPAPPGRTTSSAAHTGAGVTTAAATTPPAADGRAGVDTRRVEAGPTPRKE